MGTMPLNHAKNLLFIHVPKTGGSAVMEALGIEHNRYNNIGTLHQTAKGFKEYVPEIFDCYYKFAFVRNPFDRLVSAFFYNENICEIIDFDDFVKAPLRDATEMHMHFRPQYDYIAIDDKVIFDVYRFEDFEANLQSIMERFGITGEIKKINGSYRNEWEEYYTDELKDIVKNIYAKDFVTWYPHLL